MQTELGAAPASGAAAADFAAVPVVETSIEAAASAYATLQVAGGARGGWNGLVTAASVAPVTTPSPIGMSGVEAACRCSGRAAASCGVRSTFRVPAGKVVGDGRALPRDLAGAEVAK